MEKDIFICGIFKLGKLLGKGSFGQIYLGTKMDDGQIVAIKLVLYMIAYNYYIGKFKISSSTINARGKNN